MNELLDQYRSEKENITGSNTDGLHCFNDVGQTADKWLVLLQDFLQLKNGLPKKKLLKRFFHEAKQHIDVDKNKHELSFAKLLAHEALFIAEMNSDDCVAAFRVATMTCRRVPFIHIAFAQFQVNSGRRDKATKILETAKLLLPASNMIDVAVSKLKTGCDDIGLKEDKIFRGCVSGCTSQNKIAKLELCDVSRRAVSLTNTSIKSPFRPIQLSRRLDALDIPPSPRTPAFKTPDRSRASRTTPVVTKFFQKDLTGVFDIKTPSPPKLTHSVTKSRKYDFQQPLLSSETKSITSSKVSSIQESSSKEKSKVGGKPQRVLCSLQNHEHPEDFLTTLRQSESEMQSFDFHETNVPKASNNVQEVKLKDSEVGNPCLVDSAVSMGQISKVVSSENVVSKQSSSLYDQGPQIQSWQGHDGESRIMPPPSYGPSRLSCQEKIVQDPYDWVKSLETILVRGKSYIIMRVLGEGGSSKVYEALDAEAKILKAIKRVNLKDCDETVKQGFLNEVKFLEKLRNNPTIVHLYNYELVGNNLLLVMECGSTDLAKWIKRNESKLMPYEVKYYWMKMLAAVQTIHDQGVIHLDLKPANFLIVKGNLKLIDFGIANSIQGDATSVIKDTQFGTLNYMAPETILDMSGSYDNQAPRFKISPRSDVWSLGCILYSMMYGRTPFQHITHQVMKLAAITNVNHKINFPDYEDKHFQEIVQHCLLRDPKRRPTIKDLIKYS